MRSRERPTLDGWGLTDLENSVPHVLPDPPAPRKRRLEDAEDDDGHGEEERMLAAVKAGVDGEEMALICVLALDTGMRLSELLDIRVGQIKRTRGGRYIERPDSKNTQGGADQPGAGHAGHLVGEATRGC